MMRLRRAGGEILWIGIPLLTILLVGLRFDVGAPITDLFHEGEYLASAASVAHAGQYGYPLLVHGLLNFLPFEWATDVCGSDRAFACTRAINALLTILAMAGYLACAVALVGSRRDLRPAMAIATVALFLLVNGRVPNHVYLHQGAPAIRDLLLLPELLLLILASRSEGRWIGTLALAGGGLLAAMGLFWAYNRGLIGIGLLGTHAAVWTVARRSVRGPLAACAGLAIGLAALYLSDPAAFAAHLHNIRYWATHGSLWQSPARLGGVLPFYGLMLALMGWVAFLLLRAFRSNPEALEIGAVLLVQGLAFIQVAHGRPDGVHFAFGMPALLLLGLFALRLRTPGWLGAPSGAWLALALLLIVALDVNTPSSTLRSSLGPIKRNLKHLAVGMPRNESLFSPRERIAASILAQGSPCTYTLEGSGVLYALSGRPSCSRFLYPAYVGPQEEGQLIADLARARPQMLVVASHRWSMFLDGRPPAERAPRLAAWVNRHYPFTYRVGDFVIRADRAFRIPDHALRVAADASEFESYNPQAPAP